MKKNKLRVGIIGLGRISPRHIDDSIKQIDELELAAVCDSNKDLVKAIAKREKLKYYTDYKKIINDKKIDVVSILTPNYLHHKIGIYTAQNGKHCVLEKPIALNYKQGLEIVNAFKKNKAMLFPVLQVRYNPTIRIVRDYVLNGVLGKILTARLSIHWNRPQKYYDESPWKGKRNLDGGALLTQAIHYIDSMQWILGKVKSVYAKVDTVGHKIEVEDIANAIIDFENGTRVNFDFTVCTYPFNLECSLTLLGETGSVKIGGAAMDKIEIWEVANTPKPYIPESLNPNIYASGLYAGSCPNHKSIYENMVDVLLNGKESFIKPADPLESLRIIDGIIESSHKKREIVL